MSSTPQCRQCGAAIHNDAPEGLCPRCLMRAGLDTGVSGASPGAADARAFALTMHPGDLAAEFPQLEILGTIGHGGMGSVYKARQPGLDRIVALKILAPKMKDDPMFSERFNREARALARLSHPNIVSVYDFGQANGRYYLIMEYVEGVNLRETIRNGKLTPEEALAIVPKICDALQYAHDEGIVHRDIKPENILIDKRGRVKIADFGLAKMLDPTARDFALTGARDIMGTPHYMAPEQMRDPSKVDHRADIYALGVVFYEMLTGQLPIGRFPLPSQRVTVDVRLDEVVLRTLEFEPDRRYQHASEVKSDVENITKTFHTGPTSPAPPPNVPPLSAATPASPASRAAAGDRDSAFQTVQLLAIAMLVIGIVDLMAVLGMNVLSPIIPRQLAAYTSQGLSLIAGILLVSGGAMMLSMRSRGSAIFTCVVAIIPLHPGAVLGIPLGIWGLIRLSDSRVSAVLAEAPQNPPSAPRQDSRSFLGRALGCLVAVLLGLLLLSIALSFTFTLLGILAPAFIRHRASAEPATINLVRNPGFDDDLAQSWPPTHWEISLLDAGTSAAYDTARFRGGVASIKLSRDPSSTQPRVWARQTLRGAEGYRRIRVSFEASTTELRGGSERYIDRDGDASIRFWFARATVEFKGDFGTVTTDLAPVTADNEWHTHEQNIVVPAGTTAVALYFEVTGAGTAWFDNASVVGLAERTGLGAFLQGVFAGVPRFHPPERGIRSGDDTTVAEVPLPPHEERNATVLQEFDRVFGDALPGNEETSSSVRAADEPAYRFTVLNGSFEERSTSNPQLIRGWIPERLAPNTRIDTDATTSSDGTASLRMASWREDNIRVLVRQTVRVPPGAKYAIFHADMATSGASEEWGGASMRVIPEPQPRGRSGVIWDITRLRGTNPWQQAEQGFAVYPGLERVTIVLETDGGTAWWDNVSVNWAMW